MPKLVLLTCALLLGISAGFVNQAWAWGGDGHRTVAAIAFKLLPPEKAAALDQLLRDSDVDRGFVDAASYADEIIRDQDHGSDFDAWHYVNWPVNKNGYSAYCMTTCIIRAIGRQITRAANSSNPEAKALALSWILHLVGDLHQPLHVGDHGDKGGTTVEVKYRGERRCANVPRLNLHKAWDSCLVFELADGRDWQELADDLRGDLTTWRGHPAAEGDYKAWARESHDLARDVAYRGVEDGVDLQDDYIAPALEVVRAQLLNAGVRLAKIIDENIDENID